jgi:sulfate transport system substrate-binding protein
MHRGVRGRTFARWAVFAAVALLGAIILSPIWSPGNARGGAARRTIVAHGAVALEEVFVRGVFPAFEEEWRRRTGEEVRFVGSFSPLGIVTEALLKGAPAHIALLSAASGAQDLEVAGVAPSESSFALPHGGVMSRTPIIIAVRPGNPLAISGFEDLARPGVEVIQPDPLVSGTGQWVIFAEYGSTLRRTGDSHAATAVLLGIARNVAARASSPLEAGRLFAEGLGDVLVTSEHEVLGVAGLPGLEIIYPRSTILGEPTPVVIERNVQPAERGLIEALLGFIWSEAGQGIFARHGFRSVEGPPGTSRRIEDPFLIGDLGGWKSARREIVEGIWRNRVLKEIRR